MTNEEMTRVRFAGKETVSLERAPLPKDVSQGEVLIRVQACGICGTEISQFKGRWPQPKFTPGHECAGTVVRSSSADLDVEERVAVIPLFGCGTCRYCVGGRANLCAAGGVLGEVRDGAMATHMSVPAQLCRKIPDALSFEEAALLEPLSVAVHGLRRCGDAAGRTIAVVGGGAVGLMFVQTAKAMGASRVICAAKHDFQGKLARRLGADVVVPASGSAEAAGGEADVAVDTAGGRGEGLGLAMKLVRRGGTVVAVGGYRGLAGVDMWKVVRDELTLVGAFCYTSADGTHDMDRALQLCVEQTVALEPLVSHRFELSRAQEAFETAADKAGTRSVRVLLMCGQRT